MYRDRDGWSQDEYDKKINWLSTMLGDISSDVWAFQELWHAESLKRMFTSSGLDKDYTLLVPADHNGKKIICAGAVKSDILIGEPEWIKDFNEDFRLQSQGDDPQTSEISVAIDSFSRPILHFKIKPRSDGQIIHVYVCHFKSKRPTQIYKASWYNKQTYSKHVEAIGGAISTIRRTAEAAAFKWILTERMKETSTPVVVLGDFNDSKHSNTLNILTGQPRYLLSGHSMGGSDVDLYSVGTLQEYRSQRDVYYTHIFNNTRESLDHILVSQEFYDNSKKRLWAFKGLDIHNDHLNNEEHKENGSTDHGIVSASFEYRPVK